MAPKRKQEKTTGSSKRGKKDDGSVAVKSGYNDKWNEIDKGLWFIDYDTVNSSMVAAFDMDQTLIDVKSGATFPKNRQDWVFWDEKVPAKIQQLHSEGLKIVIITNQKGVSTGKTTLEAVLGKIDDIQSELNTPLCAFVLTEDNIYRKPCTASWNLLESHHNGGVKIDKSKSFYCGDAAGRPKGGKRKKKDHSDGDLKFALNLKVEFKTPEMLFLDEKEDFETEFDFDPRLLGEDAKEVSVEPSENPEVVLMVGSPGVGKSTFARKFFPDYEIVNQDTLKTKDKVTAAVKKACSEKKSCVVDNQNKEIATRKPFIDIAKKAGMSCRAIYLNFSKDLAFHNNAYRMLNPRVPEHRKQKVPQMIIHSFFKNCQPPTTEEGLESVVELTMENHTAGPFDDPLDEELYKSFCVA